MTESRSNLQKLRNIIRTDYTNDLVWDIYRKVLLYKGSPYSFEQLEGELNDKYDIDFDFDKICRTVPTLIENHNPVKDYLSNLNCTIEEPVAFINEISNKVLGITTSIEQVYFLKFLIGAVARVFEPGCKLDTVLILQGKQGIGKSTVFSILGGCYFDELKGNVLNKDTLLTLHSAWILEWSEVDAFLTPKNVADVKSFISCASDNYRELYAKETKRHPRQCVIVGTCNKKDFLHDESGNRRFWVISIPSKYKLNLDLLRVNRDAVWSCAYHLYKNGYEWWLTEEEQIANNEANTHYLDVDAWYTPIAQWLAKVQPEQFTTMDVLKELTVEKADKAAQMRISKLLVMLGYEKGKSRKVVNGVRDYYWSKVEND